MRKTNTEKLTSQSLISRRALLVGGVQAALVGVLGARMHYLPITRKSQILMCAPVRVAKFTTDSTVLRSLSEEMAKSTQDSSGVSAHAAFTTILKTMIELSNEGEILHAVRSNILQQETSSLKDVVRSTRNAMGASVMATITSTSYHGGMELRKLEKSDATVEEKLNMIRLHVSYAASGIQRFADIETDPADRDILNHFICYGTGIFENPHGKSDLKLSTDLRGMMHIVSIIALSREALINFERAAQLDETLSDPRSLELIRSCVLHVATVVAGGSFSIGVMNRKIRLKYDGIWTKSLGQCETAKAKYRQERLKQIFWWNAVAVTIRDISKIAIATKGYNTTKASISMINSSLLVKMYDEYVHSLSAPDQAPTTPTKTNDGMDFQSMKEWHLKPPTNLLEFILMSYPFVLANLGNRLYTDEVKQVMNASAEEQNKMFSWPPSKEIRRGRVKVDAFPMDSAVIYIPKKFRLVTMVNALMGANGYEGKLSVEQVWTFTSKLSKSRSRSPLPLPTAAGEYIVMINF